MYKGKSTNLGITWSFTKLTDIKLERCQCAMKESLNNIITNLECAYKFSSNAKNYRLQYIKHLPKTQYFSRG